MRVSSKRKARVEAMRIERKKQDEAKWRAAEVEAMRMEAERLADVIKADKQAATVELAFQISYWIYIAFRFISER